MLRWKIVDRIDKIISLWADNLKILASHMNHGHVISVTFLTFVEFQGSNVVHFTHFESIRQE